MIEKVRQFHPVTAIVRQDAPHCVNEWVFRLQSSALTRTVNNESYASKLDRIRFLSSAI
jgi:hypothetical protein